MSAHNIGIITVFIVYIAAMILIGMRFFKGTETLSDYVLGGRKLNSWVTALSAQASDMSGWLMMGLPGAAYLAGIEASWIAIGLAVGTYLNWKIIARRLRKYTEISGNSITLSDFFENRFRDNTKVLRTVSAIFILIFFLFYTASGFVAGGKLFSSIFDIPYLTALSIGVLVIICYTFLGGFLAVCWTDFVQGTLMFLAMLVVPFAAMEAMGGIGVTFDNFNNISPHFLSMFTATDGGTALSSIAIISSLAWGLGYFGQPHILVRFMGIRSSGQIKKSRLIAMVWVILSLAGAILVGMVGRLYISQPLANGAEETVFMLMVNQLFPTLIAGILLVAALAAIMSTADSQLLVTASAFAQDFYKALFKKESSDKELVWVGRFAVIVVAVIAYFIAFNPESSVLDLVSYAWAGFGAVFGPTIIMSLFWKRMTRSGALAGMITGGVLVIIWKQLSGGIFDLYEIVPGFVFSLVAIYVFSMLSKKPSKEIEEEFDSVNTSNI